MHCTKQFYVIARVCLSVFLFVGSVTVLRKLCMDFTEITKWVQSITRWHHRLRWDRERTTRFWEWDDLFEFMEYGIWNL